MPQQDTGAMPEHDPILPPLPFVPDWSRHDGEDDQDDDAGDDSGDTDAQDDDGADEADDAQDDDANGKPAAKKTAAKKVVPAQGGKADTDLMDGVDPKDPRWKSIRTERLARQQATKEADTARRELAEAQKKIQEFEDSKKSDLEKAQAAAERALAREKAANERAVRSELRTAAVEADALDPTDVMEHLERRMDDFLTDDGINTEAISKAVEELLAKKPHWRKPAAGDDDGEDDDGDTAAKKTRTKRKPAVDPAQGSKGGQGAPNWDDPKAMEAEMRRLGLQTYNR